jgi:stage V sporulation protein K
MKKKSYPLALVLNIASLLVLLAGIVFAGHIALNGTHEVPNAFGQMVTVKGPSGEQAMTGVIVFAISVIQFLLFRIPLRRFMEEAIIDNEYDEFGRNKKKTYNRLSRQEREAIDAKKTALSEQLLPTSVMAKITKKGSENPEEDLRKLIGLQGVKNKLSEMEARMKFEMDTYKAEKKKRKKDIKDPRGMNGRHFVFYGSPGTGKTTAARIVAGILYKYGYIKKNKVIEINGSFLKAGEYSEQKTKLVIQQAYDGVLFIDEAYSIVEGSEQYGKAVIAELIKEMEDNRDRFTVILAGYKDDMKRLLEANTGFKSRIKEYIEFPDYDTDEMRQIFMSMANGEGFVADAEAMDNFDERIARERNLSTFGNGRTARNVLDEAIDRHALNYGNKAFEYVDEDGDFHPNEESRYILRAMDISTMPNKDIL